jgi:hypothetical protein
MAGAKVEATRRIWSGKERPGRFVPMSSITMPSEQSAVNKNGRYSVDFMVGSEKSLVEGVKLVQPFFMANDQLKN